MTKPRDRTCILCVHLRFMESDSGYSEYTPGTDASMRCGKNHFNESFDSLSEEEFRKTLKLAATCKDFKADPA